MDIFAIEQRTQEVRHLEKDAAIAYVKEKLLTLLTSDSYDTFYNSYDTHIFKDKLTTLVHDKQQAIAELFENGVTEAILQHIQDNSEPSVDSSNNIITALSLLTASGNRSYLRGGKRVDISYPAIDLTPTNIIRIIKEGTEKLSGQNMSMFIFALLYTHEKYKWHISSVLWEHFEKEEKAHINPLDHFAGLAYPFYANLFLELGDWKYFLHCTMQYIRKSILFFESREADIQEEMKESMLFAIGSQTWRIGIRIIDKFGVEKYNQLGQTIRDQHPDRYYKYFEDKI